ncbi:MAG: glycosyltransferase, partial [Actinobacteria bacterium]|nr:glycosyltransferase [Actinomycetota bacterium]
MLRALFVSYSGVLGGGERILVDLVSRMPGAESSIACPEGALAAAARSRGLRVELLRGRRLELRDSLTDLIAAPARLAGHAAEIRSVVSRRRPDVVIGWGTRSAMASAAALRAVRGARRPRFVQQGNDLLPGPLIARAARAVARSADLVVSLSETIARDLDPARRLGERGAIVYPGVDLDAYAGIAPPADRPRVLVLSAIVGWKRPMLALDSAALATKALPDLEITVAGA